jgi:hypothetical protein
VSDTLYSVICTDAAPELDWQCELLEYTWRAVGQPGTLVRLVAAGEEHALPTHVHAQVLRTPPSNVHPESGDRYIPYNRLYSLQAWLARAAPDGTVLILDPDMVFRAQLDIRAAPGRAIGQHWVDFGDGRRLAKALGVAAHRLQPVTWPLAIHTSDLTRLLPVWIERTADVRRALDRWESDMFGLVLAAADLGLEFGLSTTCAWMPWPEDAVRGAPLLHYCQPVKGRAGDTIWYKREYQPWSHTFDPSAARLDYARDLLCILRDYALRRTRPSPS